VPARLRTVIVMRMRIQMERKRILIVEDNPLSAKTAQISLIQLGYEADQVVASGEDAIRIAEQTTPDLVLMDIELNSEMDGIEAGSQIRSRLNIPVIYLRVRKGFDLFLIVSPIAS
jgi:two-component system, cell cycle sensor histidine kinase and response regulator CckA